MTKLIRKIVSIIFTISIMSVVILMLYGLCKLILTICVGSIVMSLFGILILIMLISAIILELIDYK